VLSKNGSVWSVQHGLVECQERLCHPGSLSVDRWCGFGVHDSRGGPPVYGSGSLAGSYFMLGMPGNDILSMNIATGSYKLTMAGSDVERAKTVQFTCPTDTC
jgi:hypothetical protein